MKRKREPIDELIDAVVWIRAQTLQGLFRDGGAGIAGCPRSKGSRKAPHSCDCSDGKAFPRMTNSWDSNPKHAGRGPPANCSH
jgi:hypothetical protein